MSAQEAKAGGAYVEVSARDKTAAGLAAASARLKSWSATVGKIGAGFDAAGAMITGAIASALPAQAETVTAAIKPMQMALGQAAAGSEEQRRAFRALGLSWQDLFQKDPAGQMGAIVDALNAVENPTSRAALAMKLLGEQGRELLAIPATVRQYAFAQQALGKATKGVWVELGAAVAPIITPWLEAWTGALKAVRAWIADHKGAIQIVFQLGSVLGGVGAVLLGTAGGMRLWASMMTGVSGLAKTTIAPFKMLSGLWSGLAGILGVAGGGLAGFLVPLAAIAAAVAAGYFIWQRWGDQIKAAIDRVVSAFAPVAETVMTTIDGIKDALTAGDIGLAAKIGLSGLKLAFLQALDGIAQLVPASMNGIGEDIKSLGADVLQGNWGAVVEDMRALWASFTGSVVELMTRAASKVAAVWRGAVEGIANWMLTKATQGGAMGAIMRKVVGVDLKAIADNDAAKAPERVAMKRRNLEEAIAVRREQMAAELAKGDQAAADESLRAIQNFESELQNVGLPAENAAQIARNAVKTQMDDWQKSTDEYLAAVRETATARSAQDRKDAQERAQAAREQLGTRGFADQLAEEEKNLAEARRQAADKAAKAKKPKADDIAPALVTAQNLAGAGGTFSAAAALEMWSGTGREEVQKDIRRDTTKLVELFGAAVPTLTKILQALGVGWK